MAVQKNQGILLDSGEFALRHLLQYGDAFCDLFASAEFTRQPDEKSRRVGTQPLHRLVFNYQRLRILSGHDVLTISTVFVVLC